MANEGGSNLEKKIVDLSIMFQKGSLQFQHFQEQQYKKAKSESSEVKKMIMMVQVVFFKILF